jgi:DNA-directed RNA polymerase subunit B
MIDVSEQVDDNMICAQLDDMEVYQPDDWTNGDRVHVNGDIYGIHDDGLSLVRQFKNARRRGLIPPEVSIRHDQENRDIFINTDKGRILRPLLILHDGAPRLTPGHLEDLKSGNATFADLLNKGVIEWVDAEEEEDLFIAPKPFELPEQVPEGQEHAGRPVTSENVTWTNLGQVNAESAELEARVRMPNGTWATANFSVPLTYSDEHTHCEIDPQLMLGVCASLIPYPEHNSTPRVTGGTAMVKQSLGLPSANYRLRPDTRAHVLHYPHRSITRTDAMATTGFDERPGGQNFIVAIMSLHGYNMQDAVIMNRGSVDRALGRSSFNRTYNAERKRFPGGQVEEIEKPGSSLQEVKGLKPEEAYKHLEGDGLPIPEVDLSGGDVLVGKTSPPRFLEETGAGTFLQAQERRESSMLVRHGEQGHVDNVYVTESLDSGRLVRVIVRSHKVPEVGDKFASRHGQKGVIGRLLDPEDMPFTEDGVVPDLIINPHAIPSRMTVAHVLEMIGGKVGSMEGRRINGTAFRGEKESSLRDALVRNGFAHSGRERMVNGETGEAYPAEIFVGCIFYQRLHHLVSSKIHARSRGRVQILTRQPTEGRARQGGLRFGEMERDCLIAHGASMVIKDRLLDESDGIDLFVCAESGHIAWHDPKRNTFVSPIHGDGAEVYKVQTSYAFKLLLDEMKSLGVAMRLELEDRR